MNIDLTIVYVDTLKREFIDTNGFLSGRVVVDVHGFYTELHFGVKA